jgi:flagellar basal body-associated protein FliL
MKPMMSLLAVALVVVAIVAVVYMAMNFSGTDREVNITTPAPNVELPKMDPPAVPVGAGESRE